MKLSLILFVIVGFSFIHLYGQTVDTANTEPTEEIFTFVEQLPSFPGGQDALNQFIVKNLQYPAMARENGTQGKVFASFKVDKKGVVSNIKIVKGIGDGCDEEVIRVLSKMPTWIPGMQDGKPVNVMFRIPINFTIR